MSDYLVLLALMILFIGGPLAFVGGMLLSGFLLRRRND